MTQSKSIKKTINDTDFLKQKILELSGKSCPKEAVRRTLC